MKKIFIIFFVFLSISLHANESMEDKEKAIAQFLKEYPISYQDVIVNNKTVLNGTCRCPERYKLLHPVLKSYIGKEFSVLDIGAAQGYFDFKIAYDYPGAHCTMLEGGYGQGLYADYPERLLKLCNLNSNLKHITFLQKQLIVNDLVSLNEKEHFDIVLAFLVMHLFPDVDYNHKPKDREISNQKILDNVLKLGDNVVIEVVPARRYNEFVKSIQSKYNAVFLGFVLRDYNPGKRMGALWWIKNKPSKVKNTLEVSRETYDNLCGVYPKK